MFNSQKPTKKYRMLADIPLFEVSLISAQALAQYAKHETFPKQRVYPGGNQNLILYLRDGAFQNARGLV